MTRLPDIDVIACGSAREAITATKRFEFGVITTGLSLPDMEGYALIAEIRKQQKNRDTPIFVVSGDSQPQMIDIDNTEMAAVTAYFDKAEGHRALVNFICDFLDKDNEIAAKLMYIDPSATSAAITTSILLKNNFELTHFKDGASAIAELKLDFSTNRHCSYDALITDLTLNPDMSGFNLIKTIRSDLKLDYLTLPILLMTVEPSEDERTDFTGIFGAGTNDFITKPVSESVLVERLLNLVNIKRQNEALQP